MKTILFDLDGTLLSMEQETFTKMYFKALAGKLAPYGYDPTELMQAIWKSTDSMVKNEGLYSNEKVFWDTFSNIYGKKVYDDKEVFDEFYLNDFDVLKDVCGYDPQAQQVIKKLKKSGYNLILASNPIFPMVAQKKRMQWAGLSIADFEYITSYENSRYCKPNPKYYIELAEKIGCETSECLLVGNDVTEDMVAIETGMKVFLLTNMLINRERKDISQYQRGNLNQFVSFVEKIG